MKRLHLGLIWAIYVALVAVVTWQYGKQPAWNLDGLFYSALTFQDSERPKVQRRVYREVGEHIPEPQAKALLGPSKYRASISTKPEVFALQLGFYRSKPAYYLSARVLRLLGVPGIRAPYVVSIAAFGLLAFLMPILALRLGAWPPLAFTLAAIGLVSPQLEESAILATPDGLGALFFASGLGLVLALGSPIWALLPFGLAILTRPDLAIMILVAHAAIAFRDSTLRLKVLGCAAGLAMLAAFVPYLTDAYTWPIVMRHTFVRGVTSEAELHAGFSLREYGHALWRGLRGHMTSRPAAFVPFLVLALVAIIRAWRARGGTLSNAAWMLCAVWLGAFVRYLAFPVLGDRFFAPCYVMTLVIAAVLLRPPPANSAAPANGLAHL